MLLRPLLLSFLLISSCALAQSKAAPAKAKAESSSVEPAPPAAASGARLPVRRVVLYKNGVGYFEHTGQVRGSQEVNIDFTTGQLNDVVKSLTVLDLGQGRISSVRYNSTAPLSERLKGLRLPVGQETTLAGFLAALRGARVEIRNGTVAVAGRLLSVDERPVTRIGGETVTTVTQASVVTDTGEMRVFEVTPATSIRVLEHDLNMEVGKYMNLVASTRERDIRRMTISSEGAGERPLFVSYISEVPIWKSTYRIVLPTDPKAKPLLQGWAIVDNTVGEDWKDVQLSLVAGAPQSFIQQISQPYYARRPEIGMPEAFELTPQTHQETMNANGTLGAIGQGSGGGIGVGEGRGIGSGGISGLADQAIAYAGRAGQLSGVIRDPSGAVIPNAKITATNNSSGVAHSAYANSIGQYRFDGLPPGSYSVAAEAPGFNTTMTRNLNLSANNSQAFNASLNVGQASETVEVSAAAPPMSVEEATTNLESDAEGRDLGDLFEYNLKQHVTIGKNQSALVPIVHANITADKVSLWNPSHVRALRAIWVKNTSGQSLDGGTFNILENNIFAGEGVMDMIKPNEKRLLSYAVDQGIRVDAESGTEREKVTRVRILHGLMTQTTGRREKKVYKIHNADTDARNVVIEHPLRAGWKLTSETKPVESTVSFHRFLLNVEPNKTAELTVEEFEPQESRIAISGITDDQIALFVRQKSITPEMEQELRRVVAQKNVIAAFDNQIQLRQRETNDINVDQQRVRENMKALKGTPEEKLLTQRYATQLNQQEDRLATLRTEIAGFQKQREAAQSQLYQMIEQISMDVTL